MSRSIVVGGLVALVVLVGLGSLGLVSYNAGVTQGLAESGKLVMPAVPEGRAAIAPWLGYPNAWGIGFGPLGCLLPLLVIMFFFLMFRLVFWGARGRRWGGYGRWHHGWDDWEHDVPPFFEGWHRKAHADPESGEKESGSS